LRLFDLHCDTGYELYKQNKHLQDNDLHISLERARDIETYVQVMAICCDNKKDDETCFFDFLKIQANLLKEVDINTGKCAPQNGFYLSVEDARLLSGKIERLNVLYDLGVRFLIPMWSGETCIGGSFDTDAGLTEFGKDVIKHCFEMGIVPDVSHSSEMSAKEIFDIALSHGKPVIASHSCSFGVYDHPRNLRDDQFKVIKELGGIVGLSLCRYHLTSDDKCDIDDILRHIDRYLNIGGERMLCLGADMDGAPLPDGISGIESIPHLYEIVSTEFGKDLSDKITWENAYNFVKNNF